MKIALSGRSGSGKSAVARHLVAKHNFAHASTGVICRQISAILFDNETKQSLNRISIALRTVGKDLFIEAALRNITKTDVVFDSVRYSSDIGILRASGFKIWRIECPIEECIRRLGARGQVITAEDLAHPSEHELNDAVFDLTINNHDRTTKELEQEIDLLLQS